MPSPVAHTLAGITLYLLTKRPREPEPLRAAGLIVVANLPDIDFIAGYLVGRPAVFHWGATHSFVAALLFSGVTAWIAARRNHRFGWVFALVLAAYLSHILLDFLTGVAESPTVGLQLFWPFTSARFLLNIPVFLMAPFSIPYPGPLRTLFSREMLPVIGRELILMLPVFAAASVFYARRVRRGG